MDEFEYKKFKKLAADELGSVDSDSLYYLANKAEKEAKKEKTGAIVIAIISVPLCILIVGFFTLTSAVILYISSSKDIKRARTLREFIRNDPELAV